MRTTRPDPSTNTPTASGSFTASTWPGGSPVAVLLAYAVLYCLLDWVSFIQPLGGTDITAWNPQWALAVAFMVRAPGLAGPVAVTLLASAVQPAMRLAPAYELAGSTVGVLGVVAIALALRRWLGNAPTIVTRRALLVFMLVTAVGGAIQAALYSGMVALLGGTAPDVVRASLLNGWVGALNLVVVLPLVFALLDTARRRELAAMVTTLEWWLVCGCALLLADVIFVRATDDAFKHFYLLFLPVGWAAARFGSAGAMGASMLAQLLLILAARELPYAPQAVFELHMLLAALGATGLLIGTTVDEQHQAEEALRASLHAAAAADMAAALAHELNQPLTSLVSYAKATQLLVERLHGPPDAQQLMPIVDVTRKLATEAMRAGEVVKRLRDFFRRRGTELRPVDLREAIRAVLEAHAARAELAGVALDHVLPEALPPVMVDRVQLEVVLRNLIANALDAATEAGGVAPRVRVAASAQATQLVVEVHDSGAGIAPAETRRLFEDRRSSKPGGMGVGLSISRAIVEAHDGHLWAEPGPGGKFFFSLPLSLSPDPTDATTR